MKLADIKSKLGIPQFNLNTAKDAEGNNTEWMRHWDNDNRVAVSLHKDTIAKLKADPNIDSLGLQEAVRTGEQGDYTAIRIVMYNPAEEVL